MVIQKEEYHPNTNSKFQSQHQLNTRTSQRELAPKKSLKAKMNRQMLEISLTTGPMNRKQNKALPHKILPKFHQD